LQLSLANQTSSVDVRTNPAGSMGYIYHTSPSTPNGTLTITATGPSYDSGQNAVAITQAAITAAKLIFNLEPLRRLLRTNTLLLNATIYYPSGAIISANNLTTPVNLTLKTVNFTISRNMDFNNASQSWYFGYFIPVNGTLGIYTIDLAAQDQYGNNGKLETSTSVDRAKLRIIPPENSKEAPGKLVDVAVLVMYPNGTLLTDEYGGQMTAIANVTTTENGQYRMFYNSTDLKWHLIYSAPTLGMEFGKVATFSFQASDEYGNSGEAANAYQITVGANNATVFLAVVVAAAVPIALLIWAILSITGKRRKYKP
jgi:hypothetical protein